MSVHMGYVQGVAILLKRCSKALSSLDLGRKGLAISMSINEHFIEGLQSSLMSVPINGQ